MVRFSDISETTKETSSSEKYKRIKPNETMNDQDTSDFWESEFANSQKDLETDPYDRLLSEAFNRDEDEIDIQFEVDEDVKYALECFEPEKWEPMSEAERVSAMKEFLKVVGEKLGLIELPELEFSDFQDGILGDYSLEKNLISISSSIANNPTEIANTLSHELRHAFQHYRAEMLETWEDAIYRVNFENYITPVELPAGGWLFVIDYMDQYVEADARAFANLISGAMTL